MTINLQTWTLQLKLVPSLARPGALYDPFRSAVELVELLFSHRSCWINNSDVCFQHSEASKVLAGLFPTGPPTV